MRQRWVFALPFFALGLAGLGITHIFPYRYQSEILVLADQQKTSEQYVTSNVASLQDRVEEITEDLLSRSRLERMILSLNLYREKRNRVSMDDLVKYMRRHIELDPVKSPNRNDLAGFRIAFSDRDPQLAQQVVATLATSLIAENTRSRAAQSEGTTSFFESQLDQASKDLEQQEQRLRDYKSTYVGELPEQLAGNLQMMNSLDVQLQADNAEVDRAEQQKVYLESVLSEYQALRHSQPGGLPVSVGERPETPLSVAQSALAATRKKLNETLVTYTSQYPEVIRLRHLVSEQEAEVKRLSADADGATGTDAKTGKAIEAPPTDKGTIEMQARLSAAIAAAQIAKSNAAKVEVQIQALQEKLKLMPIREQQLTELIRQHDNAQTNYQSLLLKKNQSELATNLVKQQQGRQFHIFDAATLPRRPSHPSPFQVMLGGWVAGFFAGLGLAFVREFSKRPLDSPEAVERYAHLPVLASVPPMWSPRERSRRKYRIALETAMAILLIVSSAGFGLQTFLSV